MSTKHGSARPRRRAIGRLALPVLLLALLAVAATLPARAESLYDEASFRPLTADKRASRPGDLLTVLVFESASASTSTDTSASKSGGSGIALETSSLRDRSARLTLTEDFAGGGRVQRAGKLAAQLTVVVQDVAPNGDLLVAGEQKLRVNNERQEIVLSGRVRRIDIGEGNTIASSRLADARIEYLGEGTLSEKQSPGVVSRVLTWLGLL